MLGKSKRPNPSHPLHLTLDSVIVNLNVSLVYSPRDKRRRRRDSTVPSSLYHPLGIIDRSASPNHPFQPSSGLPLGRLPVHILAVTQHIFDPLRYIARSYVHRVLNRLPISYYTYSSITLWLGRGHATPSRAADRSRYISLRLRNKSHFLRLQSLYFIELKPALRMRLINSSDESMSTYV